MPKVPESMLRNTRAVGDSPLANPSPTNILMALADMRNRPDKLTQPDPDTAKSPRAKTKRVLR